ADEIAGDCVLVDEREQYHVAAASHVATEPALAEGVALRPRREGARARLPEDRLDLGHQLRMPLGRFQLDQSARGVRHQCAEPGPSLSAPAAGDRRSLSVLSSPSSLSAASGMA